MRIPVIQGVIDRRMLVNYRVRPEARRAILPSPFRPKRVEGWGMAGICLIRLKEIRPRGMPRMLEFASENAPHRIAVEWDSENGPREGVFILCRDSSSRFNALAGGRLFPGVHHHAEFVVRESERELELGMKSDDAIAVVEVRAAIDGAFPSNSIFPTLDRASDFFAAGSVGYSPARDGSLDGMELTARCSCAGSSTSGIRESICCEHERTG